MFRLIEMELVHWDYWKRVSLPLDAAIITIVGPNGSGKTTLLDALRTLFAIDCSKRRDYRRYARKNDEEFCWLRGIVDNTRSPSGKHPFFPILKERVTLACRIEKKGGEWERKYCIEEGEAGIEALRENATWMGVREFQRRLHEAGLTPAIAQVLSLEQGQTDKLCEKSPRDLLNLVFEVFGDKQVLDRYQEARQHQDATARELDEFEKQLGKLGLHIERTRERVNNYRQWRGLMDEKIRLAAEIKPRVEFQQLRVSIRGASQQLTGSRRELARLAGEIALTDGRLPQIAAAIEAARGDYLRLQGDEKRVTAEFVALREKIGGLKAVVGQRKQLAELAAQKNLPDPEAAAQRLGEAERERAETAALLKAARDELEETLKLLRLLETGQRADPREVAELRAALDEAGVHHDLLPEIVEVADESWQAAVEALFAPFRHVVLLKREEDRGRAFIIGERLRYRHFIVPERINPPPPTPGSLLEIVCFTRPAPAWLVNLLDRTQRVENAEEGQHQPRGQDWVTRDGYLSERRGGRHAGVRPNDFVFGRARAAALHDAIQQGEKAVAHLQRRYSELDGETRTIKSRLMGVDAARQLAARAEEFTRAAAELTEHETLAAEQGAALAALQEARETTNEKLNNARREHDKLTGARTDWSNQHTKQDVEYRSARDEQTRRLQRLRHDWRKLAPSWRDRAANEALLAEYQSPTLVDKEIDRIEKNLTEGSWEQDETVVDLLAKYQSDYQAQNAEQQRRELENVRARHLTESAREAYIDVLRATVRRYAKNLRTLGDMAGVKVEAQPPVLAADDVTLAQAGLDVKFDFDSKGFIGMNDGDASGGQQVMKSLILLIALMMEESRPGGFVFIDEPFAHLDIFNIDRVASFLRATRAQYLITTPITHNVNVYDPAMLTLVTYKKRPGEPWAPGIKKLVRDPREPA